MKRYIIQDTETGTFIDEYDSLPAAEQALRLYEEQDREENCYTPDFYEIVERE